MTRLHGTALAAVLALVALSGCVEEPAQVEDPPDLPVPDLDMPGCTGRTVLMRFDAEDVRQVVPEGYELTPGTAVILRIRSCEHAAVGNVSYAGPAQMAALYVDVTAGGSVNEFYVLEMVSDQPVVVDYLAARGFPSSLGTVETTSDGFVVATQEASYEVLHLGAEEQMGSNADATARMLHGPVDAPAVLERFTSGTSQSLLLEEAAVTASGGALEALSGGTAAGVLSRSIDQVVFRPGSAQPGH